MVTFFSYAPTVHFHKQELADLVDRWLGRRKNKDKPNGPKHGKAYDDIHSSFVPNGIFMSYLKESCTEDQWNELQGALDEINEIMEAIDKEKNKKKKNEKIREFREANEHFTGVLHTTSSATFSNLCKNGQTKEALQFRAACEKMNIKASDFVTRLLADMKDAENQPKADRPEGHLSGSGGSILSSTPDVSTDPDTATSHVSGRIANGPKPASTVPKPAKKPQKVKGGKTAQQANDKTGNESNSGPSAVEEPLTHGQLVTSLMGQMAQRMEKNLEGTVEDNLEDEEDDVEEDVDDEIDQVFEMAPEW